MEKTEKNQRSCNKQPETDLFLQWGNRKRLRCFRVRDPEIADPSYAAASGGRIRRKVTSRFGPVASDKQPHHLPLSTRLTRNSETAAAAAAALRSEHNRKLSPEKEDKYYSTRGSSASAAAHAVVEEKKAAVDGGGSGGGGGGGEGNSNNGNNQKGKSKGHVWPKLYISLSSKEKEEDFMAMKGCKPPQRPKKRAKIIQRTLLLVSPGAWLTDMCQERYEVREKKTTKKRPRGLKAMGSSMESDSE